MLDEKQNEVSLPSHIQCLKPFLAMEIMERAQQLEAAGKHIIHLEIGEPDFDTPLRIKEACMRSLQETHARPSESRGPFTT